jgi:hypothetical protein
MKNQKVKNLVLVEAVQLDGEYVQSFQDPSTKFKVEMTMNPVGVLIKKTSKLKKEALETLVPFGNIKQADLVVECGAV